MPDELLTHNAFLKRCLLLGMCLMICRDLPDKVRLDGIVTVVDAKHVSRHLDEVEADPEKVSEAVEQVGAAAPGGAILA
jgi:G3E family GTPase